MNFLSRGGEPEALWLIPSHWTLLHPFLLCRSGSDKKTLTSAWEKSQGSCVPEDLIVAPSHQLLATQRASLSDAETGHFDPFLSAIGEKKHILERDWECSLMVEHLPSMCETLSSNPRTTHQKKNPKTTLFWVLVTHAYNPRYLGGRDQQDLSSKSAQTSSPWNPISKNPSQKKRWRNGLRCRPWVQVPVLEKKTSSLAYFK
jgi:hypothetical protein